MELEPVITDLKEKGLVACEDRCRAKQAEGADTSRGRVGSLVGGERAATSRGLKRIKSQDISFQAGMIRR